MEEFFQIVQQNVHIAHWIIFGMLLLAGFNIPVSEDAMLFISALLAFQNPEYLYPLFAGVFLGAYFSDLICYWLGRKLGPKIWKNKFFAKMVSPEKVKRIGSFYEKYGIVTLIFGRFIPFGFRNGLFLTAGFGKMNFLKFALSDLCACIISCVSFFSIYYKFGTTAIDYIKKGNILIFALALTLLAVFYFLRQKKKTS